MDVSVIIVNYNTCKLTLQCLQSIYEKTTGIDFEVIVVDNASSDDSVLYLKEKNSQLLLLESTTNMGFGRANNRGAKYAKGKYLFFLNSDTILVENIIKSFFDFMENNHNIASCGCNLISKDGEVLIAHGKFPSIMQEFLNIGFYKLCRNYYIQKYSIAQKACDGTPDKVDYISGADMFIRRDIFEQLHGFDDDYFMYYEETDFYYRLHKLGLQSCLLPNVSLIHLEGGSFSKCEKLNIARLKMQIRSKFLFFRKNNRLRGSVLIVKMFSYLSVLTRFSIYRGYILQMLYAIYKS